MEEKMDWITPPDCDLRDFPYMPLDVLRLRDSALAAMSDGTIRIALLSWCASWHQVPAGSLPSDDTQLARLLGYGRDVKSWKRDRKKFGLHGWCIAQDGRLYHPVVCEKANEAWETRKKQSNKGKAGAAKRWKNNETGDGTGNAQASTLLMPSDMPGNSKDRIGEERIGEDTKGNAREQDALAWLEDACHAAGMPRGKAVNEIGRAQSWMATGMTGPEIVDTIRATMQRSGKAPGSVSSLAYFDKAIREAAGEAAKNRVTPEGMQASRDAYVSLFKGGRQWKDSFGPPPGSPGCLVSPHVLRKFGYEVIPTSQDAPKSPQEAQGVGLAGVSGGRVASQSQKPPEAKFTGVRP